MAANHPDRLIARGLPEEFIKIATTRIAAINAAYETIERGLQARMSGFAPDHPGAEVRVSPNFGPRRGSSRPDMIILHYTGMATGAAAEAWLCDPASEVSSHYLVHEDGRIVQMVRESDRAWHAGKSSWRGETDINSRSVGIEIVNPGHVLGYRNFPRRQIEAVIGLCRGIIGAPRDPAASAFWRIRTWRRGARSIPARSFRGASWRRPASVILSRRLRVGGRPVLGPGDSGAAVEELQSMLSLYGYGIEITGVFDAPTGVVVRRFSAAFPAKARRRAGRPLDGRDAAPAASRRCPDWQRRLNSEPTSARLQSVIQSDLRAFFGPRLVVTGHPVQLPERSLCVVPVSRKGCRADIVRTA